MSFVITFEDFSKKDTIQLIKVKENKVQHIKLDLHPEQKLFFSELSDSIEIIPLQLTDDSNLDKILRIVCHKGRIYLMNSLRFTSKTLHVFDRYGNFIYKIDKRGNGPDEYIDMKECANTPGCMYCLPKWVGPTSYFIYFISFGLINV